MRVTAMDGTRPRRQHDETRRQWYARHRQERFSHLGEVEGDVSNQGQEALHDLAVASGLDREFVRHWEQKYGTRVLYDLMDGARKIPKTGINAATLALFAAKAGPEVLAELLDSAEYVRLHSDREAALLALTHLTAAAKADAVKLHAANVGMLRRLVAWVRGLFHRG